MDISVPSNILESILRINDISISVDYNKYINYWPLLLVGLIFSFLISPILGKIAYKYGITYKPNTKRLNRDFENADKAMHEVETPALGGLAITIPALIAIAVLFRLDALTLPILVAFVILIIGSTLDDVINLPAKIQLGYQLLAASIIALSIIDLSSISFFADESINLAIKTFSLDIFSFPLSFVFPGDLILLFWIILCINAVKWVGGSPGLVESYSLVIFLLIFILAVRFASIFSSAISIVIAGSLISLLFFAYPSPKIMSGSPGKTTYGFLISILALLTGAKISTTIILLAIPLLDFIYVILHRFIKYKPKSISELMKISDTTHLHHQLLKLNLTSKQVLLLETSVTLLISSIVILTTGAMRYFALIFGLAIVIGLIVLVNYKANKQQKEKKESPESKYSY